MTVKKIPNNKLKYWVYWSPVVPPQWRKSGPMFYSDAIMLLSEKVRDPDIQVVNLMYKKVE